MKADKLQSKDDVKEDVYNLLSSIPDQQALSVRAQQDAVLFSQAAIAVHSRASVEASALSAATGSGDGGGDLVPSPRELSACV